jgi:colicin import membrane protein
MTAELNAAAEAKKAAAEQGTKEAKETKGAEPKADVLKTVQLVVDTVATHAFKDPKKAEAWKQNIAGSLDDAYARYGHEKDAAKTIAELVTTDVALERFQKERAEEEEAAKKAKAEEEAKIKAEAAKAKTMASAAMMDTMPKEGALQETQDAAKPENKISSKLIEQFEGASDAKAKELIAYAEKAVANEKLPEAKRAGYQLFLDHAQGGKSEKAATIQKNEVAARRGGNALAETAKDVKMSVEDLNNFKTSFDVVADQLDFTWDDFTTMDNTFFGFAKKLAGITGRKKRKMMKKITDAYTNETRGEAGFKSRAGEYEQKGPSGTPGQNQ